MNLAIFSELNWIAIFCGALGFFMLGALWYSKLLFVRQWLRYTNIDPEVPGGKEGFAVVMFASFLLMFILSTGISLLRAKLDISGVVSGVKLGFVTGLCFGVTAISISYMYEKRPLGLHLINGGYTLAGNIIASIIICSWV